MEPPQNPDLFILLNEHHKWKTKFFFIYSVYLLKWRDWDFGGGSMCWVKFLGARAINNPISTPKKISEISTGRAPF